MPKLEEKLCEAKVEDTQGRVVGFTKVMKFSELCFVIFTACKCFLSFVVNDLLK